MKTQYVIEAKLDSSDKLLKRLAELGLAKAYYLNKYYKTWDELFKSRKYKRFKKLSGKCHSRFSRVIHKIGERELENYDDTNYNIQYFLKGLETRSRIEAAFESEDGYYRKGITVKVVWEEK